MLIPWAAATRVPLNLTFTHCHCPSCAQLPRKDGKSQNLVRPIGHLLPDTWLQQTMRVCSVGCLHPSQQRHPDKTTQDRIPGIPTSWASPPAHHRGNGRSSPPGFPLSLCLWEDILSLQLEGDKWLILANGLWVEMTCHFLEGALNCQDSMAFFPTSTNHKHG